MELLGETPNELHASAILPPVARQCPDNFYGSALFLCRVQPDTPGVWATSQPSILRGERSGLQTHIATTESVSLCVRMKS